MLVSYRIIEHAPAHVSMSYEKRQTVTYFKVLNCKLQHIEKIKLSSGVPHCSVSNLTSKLNSTFIIIVTSNCLGNGGYY